MEIGITLAPSLDTPEHIRIAESLGYSKAWCFCSPAIYVDTFTMMGLAATKTERIGLGPAVMVPVGSQLSSDPDSRPQHC